MGRKSSKYRNTLIRLRDCYRTWDNRDKSGNKIEYKAKKKIVELCEAIVQEFSIPEGLENGVGKKGT